MSEVLQGDVDVPGLGKTKKMWVYGGLGAAGAYVSWRWYQASQATDDGPVSDYDVGAVGDGVGVVTGGSDGTAGNGNNNQDTDGRNTDTIDNNAEWTAKSVEHLANAGFDPAVVYLALGEFLARRSLDATEASIARAALAAAGQPPIGGPFSVLEGAAPTSGTMPAPGGLKIVPSAITATATWSPVEGAGYYHFYRNDQSTAAPQRVSGTSLIMYNLTPGREYKVQVAAVSTLGKEGTRTGQTIFKTTGAVLAAPKSVKGVGGTTTVALTWTAVPGAKWGYLVYRSDVHGGGGMFSSDTKITITGVPRNKTLRYQVAARTGVGENVGPRSSPISVKTKK